MEEPKSTVTDQIRPTSTRPFQEPIPVTMRAYGTYEPAPAWDTSLVQ